MPVTRGLSEIKIYILFIMPHKYIFKRAKLVTSPRMMEIKYSNPCRNNVPFLFFDQSASFFRPVLSFLYFYKKQISTFFSRNLCWDSTFKKVVLAAIILVFLIVGKLDSPSANPSPDPKEKNERIDRWISFAFAYLLPPGQAVEIHIYIYLFNDFGV